MPFDPKQQRHIMGRFATGVTVVTTCVDGLLWGMTANAVASLSLDPPLILVAVDKKSQTLGYLKQAQCFAVNILSSEQEAVSHRFAAPGPKPFDDLHVTTAVTGSPILGDTLGFVDCRLHEILAGGDHDIFVGEIVAGEARAGRPLLFFTGRYARMAE